MVLKIHKANIFTNPKSDFHLISGHDGGNIISITKQQWENQNNIKIKDWEITNINPEIGKLKALRFITDHMSLELYLSIVFKTLKLCNENKFSDIAILPARLIDEGIGQDSLRNRLINKRTINELLLTIYHFKDCFPGSSIKTIRLFSLSPLLIEELGSETITIEPKTQRDQRTLLKSVASYIFFKSEVIPEKLSFKYHLPLEMVYEMLQKLTELGIIDENDGKRKVLLEDVSEFKRIIENI